MLDELADLRALAEQCADLLKRAGADGHAELTVRRELAVRVRGGAIDVLHEANARTLAIQAVKDLRAATAVTNRFDLAEVQRIVAEAVASTALTAPDPLHAPPAVGDLARGQLPDLWLWDDDAALLDVRESARRAKVAERAARTELQRGTAEASCGRTLEAIALATTAGFVGGYRTTRQGLAVDATCPDGPHQNLAGRHFTASRVLAELEDPETVGVAAARRATSQRGARELTERDAPVVFAPDAGRAILQLLPRVLDATAVYGQASYLRGRAGTAIASPHVTIIDDPLVPRGPGSRPFDAEGLRTRPVRVVERGLLQAFLCNVYGARRLGGPPTGSAVRALHGTTGGTSNLILQPGSGAAADIIASTREGLLVTDVMGSAFDPLTGRIARSLSGFWISRGAIVHPVKRVSCVALLAQILERVDAVAGDLDFRTAHACPTFRVASLRIGAGLQSG